MFYEKPAAVISAQLNTLLLWPLGRSGKETVAAGTRKENVVIFPGQIFLYDYRDRETTGIRELSLIVGERRGT
jgi:hypothetical protein